MTAVFCANDPMALGLLRALSEQGRRVPEDVSVVGFDDIPEAAYFLPPLTTVRQDFGELGRRALDALVGLIYGRDAGRIRRAGRPAAGGAVGSAAPAADPGADLPGEFGRQNRTIDDC